MEDIKLNIGQNKNNSYIKINTEDDIELYEFNYEKETPVTNNQIKTRGRTLDQQQSFCYKRIFINSRHSWVYYKYICVRKKEYKKIKNSCYFQRKI